MWLVIFHNVCLAFECLCVTVAGSRSRYSLLCTARADVYIAIHACCALVLGWFPVWLFCKQLCRICLYVLRVHPRKSSLSFLERLPNQWLNFWGFCVCVQPPALKDMDTLSKAALPSVFSTTVQPNHSLLSWPTSSTIRVFSNYIPSPRLHATVMRDCPSSFRSSLPPLMWDNISL